MARRGRFAKDFVQALLAVNKAIDDHQWKKMMTELYARREARADAREARADENQAWTRNRRQAALDAERRQNRPIAAGEAAAPGAKAKFEGPSSDRVAMMDTLYEAAKAPDGGNYSPAQARAIVAEIGRENDYNPKMIFGEHRDSNRSNSGLISWNLDRQKALYAHLKEEGMLDSNGRMKPGLDTIKSQFRFMRKEQEADPVMRKEFLAKPDIDRTAASNILGKRYIRWDMAGKNINAAEHAAKRDGYYEQIGRRQPNDFKTDGPVRSLASKPTNIPPRPGEDATDGADLPAEGASETSGTGLPLGIDSLKLANLRDQSPRWNAIAERNWGDNYDREQGNQEYPAPKQALETDPRMLARAAAIKRGSESGQRIADAQYTPFDYSGKTDPADEPLYNQDTALPLGVTSTRFRDTYAQSPRWNAIAERNWGDNYDREQGANPDYPAAVRAPEVNDDPFGEGQGNYPDYAEAVPVRATPSVSRNPARVPARAARAAAAPRDLRPQAIRSPEYQSNSRPVVENGRINWGTNEAGYSDSDEFGGNAADYFRADKVLQQQSRGLRNNTAAITQPSNPPSDSDQTSGSGDFANNDAEYRFFVGADDYDSDQAVWDESAWDNPDQAAWDESAWFADGGYVDEPQDDYLVDPAQQHPAEFFRNDPYRPGASEAVPTAAPAPAERATTAVPERTPAPTPAAEPAQNPAEVGLQDAIKGGLKYLQNVFSLQQNTSAVPNGRPVRTEKEKQMYAGAGAMSPEEVEDIKRSVNPDGSLSDSMATVVGMHRAYSYYLAQGRTQEAQRMAAAMIQYSKSAAAKHGRAAELAIRNGNLNYGLEQLKLAHDKIPDNRELEVSPDKKMLNVKDQETGKVVRQFQLTPQVLLEAALEAQGGGVYKALMDYAMQPPPGRATRSSGTRTSSAQGKYNPKTWETDAKTFGAAFDELAEAPAESKSGTGSSSNVARNPVYDTINALPKEFKAPFRKQVMESAANITRSSAFNGPPDRPTRLAISLMTSFDPQAPADAKRFHPNSGIQILKPPSAEDDSAAVGFDGMRFIVPGADLRRILQTRQKYAAYNAKELEKKKKAEEQAKENARKPAAGPPDIMESASP